MRMLIVEDDRGLADTLAAFMREEHFEVDTADNGADGLFMAGQDIYDIIILDVMLPELDGRQLLQRLRAKRLDAPVLYLTAKDALRDKIEGFNLGADDYVTKPFALEELLARVRALLKRKYPADRGEHKYKRLTASPDRKEGYVDGQPLSLKGKEYLLFEYLLLHRERILTREQMFDRVWGYDSESAPNVVEVYVSHLRKKLAAYDYDAVIHTVRGVGYKLWDPSDG